MEINIDSAAINEMVSKAILDSVIGEQLRKAVDTHLQDYKMREALGDIIKAHIHKTIDTILWAPPFSEFLEAQIKQYVTQEFTGELIKQMFDQMVARYRR